MRRWILGYAILSLCLGCDDGADSPQIIGVGGMIEGAGGQGGGMGGQGAGAGGQGGGAGGQGGGMGGQGGGAGGQGGGAGGQGGGAGGQGGGGQGGGVIIPDGPGNESTDALCQNGLDDDGDGDIDCDDLHCRSNPAVTVCAGERENSNATCNDRIDNDGNGFTDCEDFACSRNPWVTVCAGERTPEECTDGVDNDGNGFTDCEDHACSRNPLVGVCNDSEAGFCLDGRDDDGDGAIDCDDSDCDVAAACQGGAGGAGGGGGAGGQGGQGGGCVPDCNGRVCGSDGCDGTCGDCDAGALCSDGQCVRDGCPDGTFECGNDCSALVDDTEHCGSCGNACPRQPGTVPLCFEAECFLGCVEGGVFESIDFARDPLNCGRCGNRCPSAIGGAPACAGGACQSPCGGTSVLCQDRCQARDVCGNACCPVLAPGERQLPALVRFNNQTWTIENAARRHVTARIRFADGTCPDLDDYAFDVMTIGSNRRIGTLASARPARGNPGWCAVVDAEVDGHFELQVRPRIDLPAGTVDLAFSAASPIRNGNPVSASGIYPAQVNGNAVSLNARFDAITRVLVYAFREVDNVRRCMRSRVQIAQAGTVRARSEGCPAVEALLRPGDFSLEIRDDGRETPDVSVVVLNAPSPTVRRPLPDGQRFDGADIPNHGIHVYTATLDHPQPVSFTLTGDDCAEGQLRLILPGETWYRQARFNDDGCPFVEVEEAPPGDMELWVSGRDMNALADYTVTSPPPIAAGPGRYRQSGIDQGATGRFDWIATENRFYTISIPEGAACTNDDSDAGSPVLRIFRDGRELASEQQIWRCPEIWERLDVGRYEITVRGGNGVRVRPFDLLIE